MDTVDEQLLTPNCCTRRVPGPYRRAILETSDSGDESSHCSKSRESMPKKPTRLGPNFGPKRKFHGNKNPQIQSSNESRGESETLKVLGKTNGLLSKLLNRAQKTEQRIRSIEEKMGSCGNSSTTECSSPNTPRRQNKHVLDIPNEVKVRYVTVN